MIARIIVAGSRDYKDYGQLADILDTLMVKLQNQGIDKSDIEIISGGCRGADELCERYARFSRLTGVNTADPLVQFVTIRWLSMRLKLIRDI